MSEPAGTKHHSSRVGLYTTGLAVLWTVVVSTSLMWNLHQLEKRTFEIAHSEATAAYEKDVLYRRWNAQFGGVYVPVDEGSQPNPYLSGVPERDIVTPAGRVLTLMNPAFMTRQVHDLAKKQYGIHGHITSLDPLRPENAPDGWETLALQAFEHGAPEVSSIEFIEDNEYMRLMKPLATEESCLQCHGQQGYKVGSIRGGISVAIPMDPLRAIQQNHAQSLGVGHFLLWLVGLSGLLMGSRRYSRSEGMRESTEQALLESEEQYRLLFESNPYPMWVYDLETLAFLAVNSSALIDYGYSRDEFLSMTIQDIHLSEDQPLLMETVRSIPIKRRRVGVWKQRKKDGTLIDVEITTHDTDFQGRRARLVLALDVTERIKAETALQESEAKFRNIIESIPIGMHMFETAPDGRVIFMGANPAADRILGGDDGRFTGMTMEEAFPQIASSGVPEALRSVAEQGGNWQADHILYKDHEISGALSVHAFQTGPGKVVAAFYDITDRKRADEALRYSERKFRSLIENGLDVITILETDGTIRYESPSIERVLGYKPEELAGRKLFELVHPDDVRLCQSTFNEIVRVPACLISIEFRFRHKGGACRVLEGVCVNRIQDSAVEGVVFNCRDITDRKRLESQLRQAQKMEAIGTLAGGIAHDFNNILAAIIGYTEIALTDVSKMSPMGKSLEEVLKAGHRAKDLVKQILAFSRMQSEQERQPLEVGLVVKEALNLLRASLPTTVEIRRNLPRKRMLALADPTQIHQVLVNLCTNAAHAMEEEGGVLEVSLSEVDLDADSAAAFPDIKPGAYLKLSVSDTGHGMGPDVIQRVFEPYFTTKDVGKGSGLGLAVVHGIVKSHGGTISVYSEPGAGATFNVYLPRIKTDPMAPIAAPASVPRGGERILLVDDEPSLVEMARRMLMQLGYRVTAKTNSVEALNTFRAHPDEFDLVITDYTMPHMTGFDLARGIMRVRPGIPVILCTGFSERITEEKAWEIGIREYALKPLSMRDIAEIVRRALDGSNKGQPLGVEPADPAKKVKN